MDYLERAKQLVARTTLPDSPEGPQGTAFLVSHDTALTCAHCLDRSNGKKDYAFHVSLYFAHWNGSEAERKRTATTSIAMIHSELDIAILKLAPDDQNQNSRVPPEVETLVMDLLDVGAHDETWRGHGYPAPTETDGYTFRGQLIDPFAKLYDEGPFLHLKFPEVRQSVAGASGTPILVEGGFCGILTNELLTRDGKGNLTVTFDAIYALPFIRAKEWLSQFGISVQSRASRFARSWKKSNRFGPLAHLMCDRNRQALPFFDKFRQAFPQKPHRPLLVYIHGPANEQATSLLTRLVHHEMRDVLKHQASQKAMPDPIASAWESDSSKDSELHSLQLGILRALYEKAPEETLAKHTPGQGIIDDIISAATSLYADVIPIYHSLSENQCTPQRMEVLAEYLTFWNKIGEKAPSIQFVVFFCLRHHQGWSPSLLWQRIARNERPHLKLAKLFQDDSTRPHIAPIALETLSSPKRHDIEHWLNQYSDIFIGSDRPKAINTILCGKESIQMAELEGHLKRLVEEFQKGVQ